MNVAELDWWRTNSKALSEIAVMQGNDARTLVTADGTVQLYGQRVSPALFAMRGIPPLLGRGLLPDDERPDTDVVVLGEAMWRQYFNAAPDIVGRRIQLNNQTLTVVGVMPPAFGEDAFWTAFVPPAAGSPGVMFLNAQARLGRGRFARDGECGGQHARPAVARHRGRARRRAALRGRTHARRADGRGSAGAARARRRRRRRCSRSSARTSRTCCSCAARGGSRRLPIRRSLGATRGRVMRQVLTESLVLAGFAALAAIAFAFAGVGLLKATATAYVNRRFGGRAAGVAAPR